MAAVGIAQMLCDAIEIADSGARSDIETCCDWAGLPYKGNWFDSTKCNGMDDVVAKAIRYSEARGLLYRHSVNRDIVGFHPEGGA